MNPPRGRFPHPQPDGEHGEHEPVEANPESSFADDPMTRLWRNSDRETGAEAIESIRERRRSLGPNHPSKKR